MENLNVDLSDLPPDLAGIMAYWSELCAGRVAPTWRDVDMMQFPPRLLPMTMVVDVFEPLEKSVFRFWGTELTRIHGVDMTGKSPYDLQPRALAQGIRADHQDIIEKKIPTAKHYSFLTARGYTNAHTALRVPIMNDGSTVSQIIIVIDFSPDALARMRKTGDKYVDLFRSNL